MPSLCAPSLAGEVPCSGPSGTHSLTGRCEGGVWSRGTRPGLGTCLAEMLCGSPAVAPQSSPGPELAPCGSDVERALFAGVRGLEPPQGLELRAAFTAAF